MIRAVYGPRAIMEMKTYHSLHVSSDRIDYIMDEMIVNAKERTRRLIDTINLLFIANHKMPVSFQNSRTKMWLNRYAYSGHKGFLKSTAFIDRENYEAYVQRSAIPVDVLPFMNNAGVNLEPGYRNTIPLSDTSIHPDNIGRAVAIIYDVNFPHSVVLHREYWEKSPIILMPQCEISMQMLEQCIVVGDQNSDCKSIYVAVFKAEKQNAVNVPKQFRTFRHANRPGIVFAMEVNFPVPMRKCMERSMVNEVLRNWLFQHDEYRQYVKRSESIVKDIQDALCLNETMFEEKRLPDLSYILADPFSTEDDITCSDHILHHDDDGMNNHDISKVENIEDENKIDRERTLPIPSDYSDKSAPQSHKFSGVTATATDLKNIAVEDIDQTIIRSIDVDLSVYSK